LTREYFIDYSMIHLVIVVLTNSCVFFSLHNWVSIIFPLVILRINCWVVVYTYLYELSQGVFKLLGSLGTTEVELGQVVTLTGHPTVVILACKWYFIVCFTRLAMSSDDSWPLVDMLFLEASVVRNCLCVVFFSMIHTLCQLWCKIYTQQV
jgi:hypothetical protein